MGSEQWGDYVMGVERVQGARLDANGLYSRWYWRVEWRQSIHVAFLPPHTQTLFA